MYCHQKKFGEKVPAESASEREKPRKFNYMMGDVLNQTNLMEKVQLGQEAR